MRDLLHKIAGIGRIFLSAQHAGFGSAQQAHPNFLRLTADGPQ
jgi:hypothetical protein